MADAEEVEVEDGTSMPLALPEFGVLARAWEADARFMNEQTPYLTRWQDAKRIGLANTKSMALNVRVLEILATVWCPLHEFPRAVPVQFLRKEASSFVSHKNLNTLMPGSFETSSETYCKDPYSNPLVLAGKGAAAPLGTPRRFSAGAFGWVWD